MKRKLKFKPFVAPTIYLIIVIGLTIAVYYERKNYLKEEDTNIYVTSAIIDSYIPVVSQDMIIGRPYSSNDVRIGINFYKSTDDEELQKSSILYYGNTYMQNSGIDYIADNTFEVYSVYDGVVISVENDDLLGKSVTIKHNNELISVYQGLSDILVEKDKHVSIGDIIGHSGTSDITASLGNHLHFEIIYKGINVDPEDLYDKSLKEVE